MFQLLKAKKSAEGSIRSSLERAYRTTWKPKGCNSLSFSHTQTHIAACSINNLLGTDCLAIRKPGQSGFHRLFRSPKTRPDFAHSASLSTTCSFYLSVSRRRFAQLKTKIITMMSFKHSSERLRDCSALCPAFSFT